MEPLPASLLNIGHRAGKERTHMDTTQDKVYYIGLAFECEHDAKIAQKALAKCEDKTREPFCVTSTTTDVATVINILNEIEERT